jgi:hypothetical protein
VASSDVVAAPYMAGPDGSGCLGVDCNVEMNGTMTGIRTSVISPNVGRLTDDPDKLFEFLDAFELARHSYVRVLDNGVDRPDVELAHDQDYRQLLRAGQRLLRVGGTSAVSAASRCLSASAENAAEGHFGRLWHGLLPDRAS